MLKKSEYFRSRATEEGDRKISLALISPVTILTLQYLVLASLDIIDTDRASQIQLLSKLLVAVLFFYALPVVLRRNRMKFVRNYLVWSSVFLLHYLMFPSNRVYQQAIIFPFFTMCLPAFIYSSSIIDIRIFKDTLLRASHVIFCLGSVLGLFVISGKVLIGTYSMSFSYYMLVPAIVFLNDFFDKGSFWSLVLSGVSTFFIVAIGSRGPVMCIAVFVAMRLIRPPRKLTNTQVLAYSLIIMALASIVLFMPSFLASLESFLARIGVHSRNIALALTPGLHIEPRTAIYREVLIEILERPLTGLGIAGDTFIFGGGYSHNIFLEVLAHYGVLVGSFVVLLILALILRVFFWKDVHEYGFIALWLCIGFCPLLVSGSYLSEIHFWIFLGLATRGLKWGEDLL